MATINRVDLKVTTNRPQGEATVTVSCDVEFTDFEVNAMNMLGLRYELQCRLEDMDRLYADKVLHFDTRHFPLVLSKATRFEHVVLQTIAAMSDLHVYIFGHPVRRGHIDERGDRRPARHAEQGRRGRPRCLAVPALTNASWILAWVTAPIGVLFVLTVSPGRAVRPSGNPA